MAPEYSTAKRALVEIRSTTGPGVTRRHLDPGKAQSAVRRSAMPARVPRRDVLGTGIVTGSAPCLNRCTSSADSCCQLAVSFICGMNAVSQVVGRQQVGTSEGARSTLIVAAQHTDRWIASRMSASVVSESVGSIFGVRPDQGADDEHRNLLMCGSE